MKVAVTDFIDEYEKIGDKHERANFFLDCADAITTWYIKQSFKRSEMELLKEFTTLINSKKFFKTFKLASKLDRDYCVEFCTVIGDYLENVKRLGDEYQPTDELKEKYATLLEDILKERAKTLSKKTGLPADMIINLLVTMPTQNCYSSPKFIYIQLNRVNRKVYKIAANISELDNPDYKIAPKQLKILYSELFGKDVLCDICIHNLLDRKDAIKQFNDRQLKMYNAVTKFTLDFINQQNKDTILDILSAYILRRNNDENHHNDSARRVKLQEVDNEEYGKISKCVARLISEKPEFARFL